MPPRKVPATPSATFTERECYQCLAEIELVLRDAVASCTPVARKGRRKTQAVPVVSGLSCAADVLEIGMERGWVE